MEKITVTGGCHCKRVHFEADIKRDSEVHVCNCSMCELCGYQHLIVPARDFRLVAGQEFLTEYRFRSKKARHLFCSVCGVKSFYVPRSNPDGYSLNARCLEIPDQCELVFTRFDGRNWSQHAGELAHLSKEQS